MRGFSKYSKNVTASTLNNIRSHRLKNITSTGKKNQKYMFKFIRVIQCSISYNHKILSTIVKMNVINKHGYKHTHRYIRRSAYNPEDKLNWAQRCCRRIQNKNISISLTAWIFKLGDELKIICGAKTMPMLPCSCSCMAPYFATQRTNCNTWTICIQS